MILIFSYWEGEQTPLIQYCINTIKNRSDSIVFTDKDKFDIDDILNVKWKKLYSVTQKVDALRIALIYKYGGMWCDADTVFLHEPNFNQQRDFIGFKLDNIGRIMNGYFYAKKGSEFLGECIEYINFLFKYSSKDFYRDGVILGETVFETVAKKMPDNVIIADRRLVIPKEFPCDWFAHEDIKDSLIDGTFAIGLNNSKFNKPEFKIDINKFNTNTLLGSILKYSEELYGTKKKNS